MTNLFLCIFYFSRDYLTEVPSLHCIFHVFTCMNAIDGYKLFSQSPILLLLQSLAADSFRVSRCTIIKSVNSDSSRIFVSLIACPMVLAGAANMTLNDSTDRWHWSLGKCT